MIEKIETKKLELDWVSDKIGNEYKFWKKGDVVTILAQTGTGKTYFVETELVPFSMKMDKSSKIILICNRVNLKRQLKKDLFLSIGIPLPQNMEDLDEVTRIGNVEIVSYQSLAEKINGADYGEEGLDLDKYDYIIADECHFLLSDSSFNNKCDLIFDELVRKEHKTSIKIFISASMDEILPIIERCIKKINRTKAEDEREIKIHPYDTGRDYSYLYPKYFKDIKNIKQLIKNDKTDDKWLIFVTNRDKGNGIVEELEGICSASFIDKYTKLKANDDLKGIIENSKFTSKVLVCTKVMDNGVNIKDLNVKHLVVMSYDKISFIQEVGRLRVDIDKAHNINLYIQTCVPNTFSTIKKERIDYRLDIIKLYNENQEAFKKKYDRDYDKLPKDIFIKKKDGNFIINTNGRTRLSKDEDFIERMYYAMLEDNMAYVKEQLSWLGLEDTFDMKNLIEDVISVEEVNKLEEFLKDSYNDEMLYDKKVFLDTINSIIDNDDKLTVLFNKVSGNSKSKGKGAKTYNKLMENLKLPYVVSSIVRKESKNGKRENVTYWIVGRV